MFTSSWSIRENQLRFLSKHDHKHFHSLEILEHDSSNRDIVSLLSACLPQTSRFDLSGQCSLFGRRSPVSLYTLRGQLLGLVATQTLPHNRHGLGLHS